MLDFFEMERTIEELAKAYPAQCATTWFKITKNYKPTQEEYRKKVVQYMKIFEYLLATYPQGPDTDKLKEFVKKSLAKEIEKVLKGDNKNVERRHKHYVINSPSPVYTKDTLKEVSEQQHPMRSASIINRISIKKSQKNKENMPVIRDEVGYQEKQNENLNIITEKRRRKKKLMIASD